MSSIRLVGPCILLLAMTACDRQEDEYARAIRIETLDQAIGGPKALAQPGDFLLENDRVRVAILGARKPGETAPR
ncbi:MAG: hypothetical protein JRI25_26065, partial [Deltaproteobacteria bacterium]|nr:hypothetical protein [Deltaproteobacteria bacterium]